MVEPTAIRRLHIGPIQVALTIPQRRAKPFTGNPIYLRVLRPTVGWTARQVGRVGRVVGGPEGANQVRPNHRLATNVPDANPEARNIRDKISGIEWYHSIDLGCGVITPGFVDHRPQIPAYQLPESLGGRRCLDVGTFDGFWAFEMERRGAAEVVALDVANFSDWDVPAIFQEHARQGAKHKDTGRGFQIAHELLGSKVQRRVANVHDLSPESWGTFDLVILSDLLLHLRDPVHALESVFSVCSGALILGEVYEPALERHGDVCVTQFNGGLHGLIWWRSNSNTLKLMMTIAGFEPVEELARFDIPTGARAPIHQIVLRGLVPARHSWRDRIPARSLTLAEKGA